MDGTRQDTENARGRSPLPRAASTASFPRGSVRRLVVRLMTVSSRRPELPVASRGPAGSGTVSATRRHADPCRPDRRGTGLHAWWSPGFGPAPGSRDRLPGGHARRGHSLSSLSPSHKPPPSVPSALDSGSHRRAVRLSLTPRPPAHPGEPGLPPVLPRAGRAPRGATRSVAAQPAVRSGGLGSCLASPWPGVLGRASYFL